MSDWSDIKQGLTSKTVNPHYLGATGVVWAVCALIFGFVNVAMGTKIGNTNSWASALNWFIFATFLAIGAYYLFRGNMWGYWIEWIMAIYGIVIGAILMFNVVSNNVWFEAFFFLAGIVYVIILLFPHAKDGLVYKK